MSGGSPAGKQVTGCRANLPVCPQVSDKVEQQTKVTRRSGASQQTWMTAVLPTSSLVLEADFFTL